MTFTQASNYTFLPRFFRLTITNTLSSIIVPLSGLVDIAFLGHLADLRYLAGVSLSVILFSYLYRMLDFLRSSTNGETAQAMGVDDREYVLLVLLRNILIALSLGIFILLLQYPIQKLGFSFLIGTPGVKEAAIDYFCIRIWAAPAVLINFVFFGWFFGREMNPVVILLSATQSIVHIPVAYLFIVRWGWASTGAGLSTVISQYAVCLLGFIIACFHIQWDKIWELLPKALDWAAFKDTLKLNGNISVSSLAQISTYFIFMNFSSAMGTNVLAENSVLMEASIIVFMVQGLGFATQTLIGSFKGRGAYEQFKPLLTVAILMSLAITLPLSVTYILFPKTLFGLFTNHGDLTEHISNYVIWLLPFEVSQAIGIVLQGYLIGLTQSTLLRNVTLIKFGIVFVPSAIAALYFHSNHLLWFAISLSSIVNVLILGMRILETLDGNVNFVTKSPVKVEMQ
ncbi:MAG: guanitoxin biosynthesis MATE family efflux transporter GntT [Rivularia sp. (in: cyanobacteria)]